MIAIECISEGFEPARGPSCAIDLVRENTARRNMLFLLLRISNICHDDATPFILFAGPRAFTYFVLPLAFVLLLKKYPDLNLRLALAEVPFASPAICRLSLHEARASSAKSGSTEDE